MCIFGNNVETYKHIYMYKSNDFLYVYCYDSSLSFELDCTGDVPRVDGQLAVARAFGDKSLKRHVSSEPDIAVEIIDDDVDFIILASDGLWKVWLSLTILTHSNPNISR